MGFRGLDLDTEELDWLVRLYKNVLENIDRPDTKKQVQMYDKDDHIGRVIAHTLQNNNLIRIVSDLKGIVQITQSGIDISHDYLEYKNLKKRIKGPKANNSPNYTTFYDKALIDPSLAELLGTPDLELQREYPIQDVQIFISYAKPDYSGANRLYNFLNGIKGFNPWMDKENLLPGEKWKNAIEHAINQSDFFIACISKNSINRRGYIQKEIRLALDALDKMLDEDIYLIPARFEECTIPRFLSGLHYVDLFKPGGYEKLKTAIYAGVNRRGKSSLTPTPSSASSAELPSTEMTFEDIYIVSDTENVERIGGDKVNISYNLSIEPPQKWKEIFEDWIRPGESPISPLPYYKAQISGKQVVIKFINLQTTKEEVKQRVEDRIKYTNNLYRGELKQKARIE